MNPKDYNETEVHRQFDDALKRAKGPLRNRVGIGTLIYLAKEGGYEPPLRSTLTSSNTVSLGQSHFDLNVARPVYHPLGMPPRDFAGPKIGSAQLFPLKALSLFVSLGGGGKTMTIMKIATHIAAGRAWDTEAVEQHRVLIFAIEETKDELDRKFGAAIHDWNDVDKAAAENNLRLFSCLDRDARLTTIKERSVQPTGLADAIIDAAREFDAGVIILDHLQGFVSGDLNNSDTATVLAQQANKIVAKTGAAVVIAAHTNKANIAAQDVMDGFTTGSLAFENAARQVVGIIPLPDEDAKNHGLEKVRQSYSKIAVSKNSYGAPKQSAYLYRVHVPDFHTVTVEPYTPPGPAPVRTKIERIQDDLLDHLRNNPGLTPNKLDGLAGKNGKFKASRKDLRQAIKELMDDGRVKLTVVTPAMKKELKLPHQAKEIYEHVD